MRFPVCIVLQVFFIGLIWHGDSAATATDVRSERCEILYEALNRGYHDYILKFMGAWGSTMFSDYLHTDLENDEDLWRLACQLADARSLQDIAEIIGQPPREVRQYYSMVKSYMENGGGQEDWRWFFKSLKAFNAEARRLGYPDMPFNITYEQALDVTFQFVEAFGRDFLVRHEQMSLGPYPYSQSDEDNEGIVVDEEMFATAIISAQTHSEFVQLSGLSDKAVYQLKRILFTDDDYFASMDALAFCFDAVYRLDLLNLL